jgi:GT2 family glycosyltransferase
MSMSAGTTAGSAGANANPDLGVSVVVATFKRLKQLSACLDGIKAQTRPADEVLVVTHADSESESHVAGRGSGWPALKLIRVERGGSVAAYNAGLRAATMPLVAYIDDDAVPEPDWLERIIATFRQDQRIAAVGGRDAIVEGSGLTLTAQARRRPPRVGKIQWFGRMTANHHIGTGPARDVDVLKGVNMSFRRAEVAGHGFDERLRGPGAVVHSELSVCLPLRRRGLRIVYDPAIMVMHYPAPRPAGDQRASLSAEATFNATHNETLQILDYLNPVRRIVFGVWSLFVGSTESPGLAVLVRDLLRRKPGARVRCVAAQRGRIAGWRARRAPRPLADQSAGIAGFVHGASTSVCRASVSDLVR